MTRNRQRRPAVRAAAGIIPAAAVILLAIPGPPGLASPRASGQPGPASGRWALQRLPTPPRSFGTNLNAVACPSTRSCAAVGDYFITAGGDSRTLALSWNGSGWAIQPTPSPPSQGSLAAVSCWSAGSCTAVGEHVVDRGGNQRPLAERRAGGSWALEQVASPGAGINSWLAGVSCPSARTCIAVGGFVTASGRSVALAERWTGARWVIERLPGVPGSSALNSVACPAARTCTAVGFTDTGVALAERWDGARWSVQPTAMLPGASAVSLESVSCPSARICAAAGTFSIGTGGPQTLAERWDGAGWTVQRVPVPAGVNGSERDAVSCPSATACALVGDVTDASGIAQRTLAERWNGSRWGIEASPSPAGRGAGFLGVSCPGGTECIAVGSYVRHGRVLGFAERRR